MKPTRHPRIPLAPAVAACAAALLLAGCERGSAPRAARQASTAECTGTDAHTTHLKKFACETCHPAGGTFGFSGTLAGGLAVTGTITRAAGLPPSCAVSCHAPDGGTPTPISWDAGPQTCGSCHAGRALVAGGSAHVAAADQGSCAGCHDLSQHLGGTVRLVAGMVPGTEAMCLRCHSGSGGSLANAPGPLLVGWQDAAGDWHGNRAGTTGSGGTLRAPFGRGDAPLACGSCHDEHASPNAFLFASVVNGAVIPAGTIDRAGVGAEVLCAACHEGERHAWCISCHAGRVLGPDPMPAGSACFYCHGHEGVVNFVPPSDYQHDGTETDGPRCAHCHSYWAPGAPEYVAPAIVSGLVNVRGVGLDTATIAWTTNEAAIGSVEWGPGALDRVNGPTALGTVHSVSLTGLAAGTTYSFRARSVDRFRNVSRSTLLTFRTAAADGPPQPVLVDEPSSTSCGTPAVVTLEWLPVVEPDGDPVEYRLVVDDSPLFDTPAVDVWTTATTYTTSFAVTVYDHAYFWRVQARDVAHDVPSPWSAVDGFSLNRYRIGQCP